MTEATIIRDTKHLKQAINIMWALVTGFLVMFMQSGFALLETGLCRAEKLAATRWR